MGYGVFGKAYEYMFKNDLPFYMLLVYILLSDLCKKKAMHNTQGM
jgi:hypothetical protein